MPITSVSKDASALTMTVVADFAASVERLWNAYTDPRQLEKFWGPVEWPATFYRHEVYPGGRSEYVMTGPDGEKAGGYWEFLSVDPGRFFEVTDGFADENGKEVTDMPSLRMTFEFESTTSGSRLTTITYFPSEEALTQLVEMGMEEGLASAMSQIDDVLADLTSFAAGRAVDVQVLDDTRVRISRVIRGPVEQVWRAHHEAELIRQWMLGPDGWTMPVCEPGLAVGDASRLEWESEDGSERFGFEGEVLESYPPHRVVTTERMIGMDGPSSVNDMTLAAVEGGTLLSLVITYPDSQTRDMVLDTGMADGMEASYARLEAEVLGS